MRYNERMHTMSMRQLVALLATLSLFLVVSMVWVRTIAPQGERSTAPDTHAAATPPPQPPAMAADKVDAQSPQGFQQLISYTDRGFEPKRATIKVGDTVRFTNNSLVDIWVAAGGDKLYPSVAGGCGSSALDSCAPFIPGRYWEFTFAEKGAWGVVNNLNKSHAVSIRVE